MPQVFSAVFLCWEFGLLMTHSICQDLFPVSYFAASDWPAVRWGLSLVEGLRGRRWGVEARERIFWWPASVLARSTYFQWSGSLIEIKIIHFSDPASIPAKRSTEHCIENKYLEQSFVSFCLLGDNFGIIILHTSHSDSFFTKNLTKAFPNPKS